MNISNPVLGFIVSGILSWLLVGAILPFLRKTLLDTPNMRSSHLEPTPRGAGIAFVMVGSLINFFTTTNDSRWIPIICLPLAIVGFIDDCKSVPAAFRYLVQFITALGLLFTAQMEFGIVTYIILILLITAIINFTNFMDGLDGLVAGCGVLLMASTSSWCLAGSIFGFLFWNWSPARAFMGDVGSTFIGAVFAGMILQRESKEQAISLFLIGFPLFADSLVCLLRRGLNGEPVFNAHNKHLFQRLHQVGWRHSNVAILYIIGVASLVAANKIGGTFLLTGVILLEIIIGVYLECMVAKPFINRQN